MNEIKDERLPAAMSSVRWLLPTTSATDHPMGVASGVDFGVKTLVDILY